MSGNRPFAAPSPQGIRFQASAIARDALKKSGIVYSVTAGVTGSEASQGRDLDLFLERKQVDKAAAVLCNEFSANGWLTRKIKRRNAHIWLFAKHPTSSTIAEIDLVHTLRWGPLIFAKCPTPDLECGGFSVDSWAAFVKCILLSLLSGDDKKVLSRFSDSPWMFSTERTRTLSAQIFGMEASEALFRDLQQGESLQRHVSTLRRQAWKTALVRFHDFQGVIHSIIGERLAKSIVQPRLAPIIAIVGPDGVGKSTLIDALARFLPDDLPYTRIIVKHWRPSLLPPLATLSGKPKPSSGVAIPPRRHVGRFSSLRLLYYSIDYWLGWLVVDRKKSTFNSLIIYDRHYVDFLLDPIRFGIRPGKLQAFMIRLIPRPDFVFALIDDPKAIFSRKPELSMEEIQSINLSIIALSEQKYIDKVFSVTGSLEEFHSSVFRKTSLVLTGFLFPDTKIGK